MLLRIRIRFLQINRSTLGSSFKQYKRQFSDKFWKLSFLCQKIFQYPFLLCINIQIASEDDFLHYGRNSGIMYFVCLCIIALLGLISRMYDQEKQERLDILWTKR